MYRYFALYMYSMPVDLRFRRLRARKSRWCWAPTLRSISRETEFVVERMKILLESGADPELQVQDLDGNNRAYSPIDLVLLFRSQDGQNPSSLHICETLANVMRSHIQESN